MHLNGDKDMLEATRRKLAELMSSRGYDDSIARVTNEEGLYVLKKRLDEQRKTWTGHIDFKTIPPKPIYKWSWLQTDDLRKDSARIKQYEKDNEIAGLERSRKDVTSELEKVKQSIINLSNRDSSEKQLANLEGLKNNLMKELAKIEEELAKLKEM